MAKLTALTKSQRRALEILNKHGPILPKQFAELMWPDSPKWSVSYRCGPYGSHRGGAMYRTAGAYLGKLTRKGLARWVTISRFGGHRVVGYTISEEGKAALKS